ncbi:hypothetical protein [Flavobacterium sp.]|uniref:hypothetical protein n=1 Tax=Flavobacterium sp. TaxID=239 RepID=UPI003F69DE06
MRIPLSPIPTFSQSNPWLEAAAVQNKLREQQQQIAEQQQLQRAQQIRNQFLAPLLQSNIATQQARLPLMQQQARQAAIRTQLLPQLLQSQIGIQQARAPLMQEQAKQIAFGLQHPLLKLSGAAGQLGAQDYLKELGRQQDAQNLLDQLKQQQENQKALALYHQYHTTPYSIADINTKRYMVGKSVGMGFTPTEAINLFQQGKSLQDLADMKGVNLADVKPYYSPTTTTLTRLQQSAGASAEEQILSPIISKGYAPYASQVFGLSPAQIADTIMPNVDKQKQIDFWTAHILRSELGNLRIKLSGATPTEAGLERIIKDTYGDINPIRSRIPADVFKAVQENVDNALRRAFEARSKIILSAPSSTQTFENYKSSIPKKLTIPTFSSKEDFKRWYLSLSPDQKSEYKNRVGG